MDDEDERGVRLFDRLGRRILLTEACGRLLQYSVDDLVQGPLAVSDSEGLYGNCKGSAERSR